MQVGNKIVFDDKETTIVNVWSQGRHRKYILADGRDIMVEPGQEHTLIDSGRVRIISQNSPLKQPPAPAPKPLPAKPKFNWGGEQNEHE